jgi:molecular chaperone DnaK (HSP70)
MHAGSGSPSIFFQSLQNLKRMPVAIKELINKAKTEDSKEPEMENDSITLTKEEFRAMKAQIIQECMERVEQLLENKKWR